MGTTGVSTLSMIVITDVVPLTDRGKYQGKLFLSLLALCTALADLILRRHH